MARVITDDELISAVLSTRTYREAAQRLGVSPNTVTRRMHDETIQERLIEARKTLLAAINNRLIQHATKAVDVLSELMNDKGAPPTVRLQAADRILNHTGRLIETENLMAEIERLKNSDEFQ